MLLTKRKHATSFYEVIEEWELNLRNDGLFIIGMRSNKYFSVFYFDKKINRFKCIKNGLSDLRQAENLCLDKASEKYDGEIYEREL